MTLPPVEPVVRPWPPRRCVQVDAQCAADSADRTARPIADHHRRQRGAIGHHTSAVDVLDDLFAALVLEIDIDVGGSLRSTLIKRPNSSVARRGSTSVTPRRSAHQRIGRTAATLAQDAPIARPVHDVGHGEEVGLVLQLRHQRSSSSSVARYSAGMPAGKRRRTPSSASRRSQLLRHQAGGHDLPRGTHSAARPARRRTRRRCAA